MTQQGAAVEVLVEYGGKRAGLGPPLSACQIPGIHTLDDATAQKLGDVVKRGELLGVFNQLLQTRARQGLGAWGNIRLGGHLGRLRGSVSRGEGHVDADTAHGKSAHG